MCSFKQVKIIGVIIVQLFSQIVRGFLFIFPLVHKVHIVLLKMEA